MNSGGLRLLRNREGSRFDSSYDAAEKKVLSNQTYLTEVLGQLHNSCFDFFYYHVIDSIEVNGGKDTNLC